MLLAGCAETASERLPMKNQIGKNCIVHFQRDDLGMAGGIPSSVMAGSVNGAETTQAGQLMGVGADWVVINYHGRELHIPMAAILMIEFGSNITQSPGLSQQKVVEARPVDHGDHTHVEHDHH
ncbi:MAG: hypothetical protein DWH91_04820 [Planctomycetota bacterium]|nr:MAG: hypothetical protein DWH91_04820 [Planctomycetota bacterium]